MPLPQRATENQTPDRSEPTSPVPSETQDTSSPASEDARDSESLSFEISFSRDEETMPASAVEPAADGGSGDTDSGSNASAPSDNEAASTDAYQAGRDLVVTFFFPSRGRGNGSDSDSNLEPTIQLIRALSETTGTGLGPAVLLISRFTEIMTQALRNGMPHTQGQPPASDAFIKSLKPVKLWAERLAKHPMCTVCQEDFAILSATEKSDEDSASGEKDILRLTCHHLFHSECISQWLETSATCPTCRYEMPTDNEDYNVGVNKRMQDWDVGLDTDGEEDDSDEANGDLDLSKLSFKFEEEVEDTLSKKRGRAETRCPNHERSSRARYTSP
ncbi:hypothetical protein PhCBS80983_g03689 [Powellomyces hirtus]|uniref:RING-type domain-containing protein n=1 Tax=Powellomyces hirtus TaxID=109895 RepID=A0A507E2X1_9FUNG|nr:hypothetical protein PhCBS80983_g03689 [Powellomyces hirtus]